MTNSLLAAVVFVVCGIFAGCAAPPERAEKAGSTASHQTREAANDCSTTEASVKRSYLIALNRPADPEGLLFWTEEIESGRLTRIEALRAILRSEESVLLWSGLDDSTAISGLYLLALKRNAEIDGITYWLGRLNEGMTKTEVAVAFTESPEFTDLSLDNYAACYAE